MASTKKKIIERKKSITKKKPSETHRPNKRNIRNSSAEKNTIRKKNQSEILLWGWGGARPASKDKNNRQGKSKKKKSPSAVWEVREAAQCGTRGGDGGWRQHRKKKKDRRSAVLRYLLGYHAIHRWVSWHRGIYVTYAVPYGTGRYF